MQVRMQVGKQLDGVVGNDVNFSVLFRVPILNFQRILRLLLRLLLPLLLGYGFFGVTAV